MTTPNIAAAPEAEPNRTALIFIMITSFLNQMGFGIIGPVLSFLTAKYVAPTDVPVANSLLFTAFSLCQFLFVPTLGALSDRYGRRPILLFSLLGSAVGFLMFGIGGSIAMLFAGRIIDGITGGNISTIYAYIADITTPQQRTRYFGLVGAVSSIGFVLGPVIGGLLANISLEAPMYFAAALTLAITVFGFFALPESLSQDRRAGSLTLAQMNPFSQLWYVWRIQSLRLILVATFFWAFAFAALPSNVGVVIQDIFKGTPANTSNVFAIFGVVGIVVQGVILRRLIKRFGDARTSVLGHSIMAAGYVIYALAAITQFAPLVFLFALVVALGNGLIIPTLNGLASQVVSPKEQGRVQGGSQAIQAFGRVLGPIWAGVLYSVTPSLPYWTLAASLLIGALLISLAIPIITAAKASLLERLRLEGMGTASFPSVTSVINATPKQGPHA
jgi:MFS transporter, DHA1 family, tetracycline resistance protein